MLDPKLAKVIKRDPKTVYGYSPVKGGGLDNFLVDWTNPAEAAIARSKRIAYLKKLKEKGSYRNESPKVIRKRSGSGRNWSYESKSAK